MGYAGVFMDRAGEYAMSEPDAYVDSSNPGASPNYEVCDANNNLLLLNDNDRAIIKAQHGAALILWCI